MYVFILMDDCDSAIILILFNTIEVVSYKMIVML